MSVLQLDELVSYQLRTSYLDEIADGVGERLITVDETFLSSVPFKAAGWRPGSSHAKRTHSPPIPTAIASEYFQAPRQAGLTLEDAEDDGGMLTGGGAGPVGAGMATKRRRRREQMEDDDSSDASDDSEDDSEQRAARQIKFSKMPVRPRAGSSPLQTSQLRQQPSPRTPRRGSQSALETTRGRMRRDTVTSSEVSSENELDVPATLSHREAARAAARSVRLQGSIDEEPSPGMERADARLLRGDDGDDDDDDDDDDEDDDSDEASDMSGDFVVESIDSALILDGVVENGGINPSPSRPVVGTPPRNFTRQSTIRKSHAPTRQAMLEALPPPRPLSTIRPPSVAQPQSLLSAALRAKRHKSSVPFQKFAHLSGQGTQGSINIRVYAPFSRAPDRPFEVLIRPRVHDGQGAERVVTVADLIGLSLYRYNEEKREPAVAAERRNINWWTLRMVEEGGEVDDDFPAFERTKQLAAFTTANNASARGGGRLRSNSTVTDDFALVPATADEFDENQSLTPQEDGGGEEEEEQQQQQQQQPQQQQPQQQQQAAAAAAAAATEARPRPNPIVTTTYRPNTALADAPQAPAATANTTRGQQKLLRIHIMSADMAAGQLVTVDVTTATYLAEVQDLVCRKRQLDKANYVLKLPGSGAVVMMDRPVSSIGNVSDLELHRRRFATDGPLSMTGSPSSSSPKMVPLADGQGGPGQKKASKKGQAVGPHPLARETASEDGLGGGNHKRYTVWRKQPMRIVGMSERILAIDGEYIHIMPASGGRAVHDGGGKTTTVHFSNVIGCKVPRKHPTNVKLVIYKATESKRYDFEARGADEAAEIVAELKKGISPYREV